MIVVLSGGAGGGRFCRGVIRARPAPDVTIVCNTADDIDVYGVRVCPDLDLVTFTLAGCVDAGRGYGIEGDPRTVLTELQASGIDTWFDLGDRDAAICMARTSWLAAGVPLHEVAARIAQRFGIESRLLPMTNARVWTKITTEDAHMHFQRWWIEQRAASTPLAVTFAGIEAAEPAPGVLDAIGAAEAIVLAPSNPVVSIGPILAVPGIRDAILASPAAVVAVTPIVEGRVFRGMADRLLAAEGVAVSAAGVAQRYRGLIDGFVLDERDSELRNQIESLGIRVETTDTVMADDAATTGIAEVAIQLAISIAKDRG